MISTPIRHAAWLVAGIIALIVALGCASPFPPTTPNSTDIASPEPTAGISDCSTIICCSDCLDIDVGRIIDGDTFQSANARIRLFGIDTPEKGAKCFSEATERFKELAGVTVRIESGPRLEDNYGRILFYVYTEDGESIDEMLIREGQALAWTRDGHHRDVLVAAEDGARRDGRGCLW